MDQLRKKKGEYPIIGVLVEGWAKGMDQLRKKKGEYPIWVGAVGKKLNKEQYDDGGFKKHHQGH